MKHTAALVCILFLGPHTGGAQSVRTSGPRTAGTPVAQTAHTINPYSPDTNGTGIADTTGDQISSSSPRREFGFGGGLTIPLGDLGDEFSPGVQLLGKLRIVRAETFDFVFSGIFNSLTGQRGGESQSQLILGAGFEAGRSGGEVEPYFGLELLLVDFVNEGASNSFVRGGAGVGGGVEWSVPATGRLDASLKYQTLNLMGNEGGGSSVSQIAATLCLMF